MRYMLAPEIRIYILSFHLH